MPNEVLDDIKLDDSWSGKKNLTKFKSSQNIKKSLATETNKMLSTEEQGVQWPQVEPKSSINSDSS